MIVAAKFHFHMEIWWMCEMCVCILSQLTLWVDESFCFPANCRVTASTVVTLMMMMHKSFPRFSLHSIFWVEN